MAVLKLLQKGNQYIDPSVLDIIGFGHQLNVGINLL